MKNTNIVLKVNGVPWMYSNMLVFVVLEWTTGSIAVEAGTALFTIFLFFVCLFCFYVLPFSFFFTGKQNNRYYNGFIQI